MNKSKIPYGISNFEELRKENYLYIDKTKYIEILENDAPYQFFIRPRRFGKSLFLSMLENYYDIDKCDDFKKIYGDLYIGKNPTEKRNSYMILNLNFAGIVTDEGKDRLIESFDNEVVEKIKHFVRRYSKLLNEKELPLNIVRAEHADFVLSKLSCKIYLLGDYAKVKKGVVDTDNEEYLIEDWQGKEITVKLLDILDDEVICEKTGLEIEIVRKLIESNVLH